MAKLAKTLRCLKASSLELPSFFIPTLPPSCSCVPPARVNLDCYMNIFRINVPEFTFQRLSVRQFGSQTPIGPKTTKPVLQCSDDPYSIQYVLIKQIFHSVGWFWLFRLFRKPRITERSGKMICCLSLKCCNLYLWQFSKSFWDADRRHLLVHTHWARF